MKNLSMFILLLPAMFVSIASSAQNPIVPIGSYMADPSARQWNDGKLYVYGSRDVEQETYCSADYDILSTSDMKTWTLHKNTFASQGKGDQVPYSDGLLYAPDCQYRDGMYHLFYCLSGGGEDEGVAVSKSPVGPFTGGSKIAGITGIDPSVFIDDDGQAYLYWGQFGAKVAKLSADMKSIDHSSIKENIITEKEHFFHEGIQMVKRNGVYYIVYAHIGRRGMATCIGYATSDSPLGPFKYRGVIVDNFGSDVNVWNNHGSIAKFNDNWYVFYHRSTHGAVTMRKACCEPITFNADGTIDEVEMTTQGAAGPLDPFQKIDAERACYLTGNVRIEQCAADNEQLTGIQNLNTAAYKYYDFKKSPTKIIIKVTPLDGGTIRVFANNLCLPLLAQIEIPKGDGKSSQIISMPITSDLMGVYPIYLRFLGNERADLFNIDWFRFE